jgi:serine/threonine-protein kinase
MSLAPGIKLGPYEIVSPLGAGGMGEVYRARDTRLGRDVAVKVLPQHLSSHPEVRARFEREAKTVSSLNHPYICTLHDVGREGDVDYLVMELVEGETLATRLLKGPFSLADTLRVGAQVADALDRAHRAGVVHRDLKPGNVMLTKNGAKLMDFGLARAASVAGASGLTTGVTVGPLTQSPTIAQPLTAEGAIVGTFQYMSPEQLEGQETDARSDIWALGCVLYEMTTGQRAFEGKSQASLIGAIMHSEPAPMSQVAPLSPPALERLVKQCLARDPIERWQSAGDVRRELEWIAGSSAQHTAPVIVRRRNLRRAAAGWIAAGVIALAATALYIMQPGRAREAPGTHVAIALADGYELGSSEFRPLVISRDGTRVAYVGRKDGKNRIFVRALGESDAKTLEGTEGGDAPFFSPDGQWIGFFAGAKLRKITVDGAAQETLADAPTHRGGSWGDDGFIYFAPTNVGGIWRVPEAGGAAVEVTKVNAGAGEISHRWPQRIAGTSRLLFAVWTGPGDDEHQIAMQSVGANEHHVLIKGGDAPQYVAKPGLLFYTHRGQLFKVPWRPAQEDIGKSVPVATAEPINDRIGNEGCGNYSVSEAGTLAYLHGDPSYGALRLLWVDKTGALTPVPLPDRTYENVAISPDERRAVVQIREATTALWIYDFGRGTLTPLATGTGSSQAPLWTPDGTRVIYRGTRQGTRNLYWIPVDGSGTEERLTSKAGVIDTPTSISSDGRTILFDEVGPDEPEGTGAWVLTLEGERASHRLFPLPASGRDAQLSPDGKWVAYQATVASRQEIFVAPFSGPGERRLISTNGGTESLWSRDGRELFFQNDTRLMGVTVTPGATFSASAPRVVHEGRFFATINGNTSFGVTRDGRFLRIQPVNQAPAITRIDLVLNWFSDLKRQSAKSAE